jgi:hypothetical protein
MVLASVSRPDDASRRPTRRGRSPRLSGWRFWQRSNGRDRHSINGSHKWSRRRTAVTVQFFSYLGTLLLGALVVQAFMVVVIGEAWTYAPLDKRCQINSVSCAILSGITVPVLSIAFASAAFLFFRVARVRKGYRRKARMQPRDLVPTAGRILERVVGRDELCYVIMDNVADRRSRQAFLIVGGVGAGKTAVLVQLTKLLANEKAIPVPIMLREAQSESQLDFREMAYNKFSSDVAGSLLYEGESSRAWRQLRNDDRIVVLADGLEEALIDNDQRNSIIRRAIERANTQKLPLIIASRPHDPLRDMAAAIIELEPLSEEAALSYIKADHKPSRGAERLEGIVETAEVADEPIYLQITRELYKNGLLGHGSLASGSVTLDSRDANRTTLRLNLLDTWFDALKQGYFPEGIVMSTQDRRIAVEGAAALACIGLKLDSVDVKFVDLLGPPLRYSRHLSSDEFANTSPPPRQATSSQDIDSATVGNNRLLQRNVGLRRLKREDPHPSIMELLSERLGAPKPDIQIAAAWGEQLGLVEMRGDGVRFPHSLIQAYLGSLMMPAALHDAKYCSEALQKPGREFLISVVMYFCSSKAREAAMRHQQNSEKSGHPPASWKEDVSLILDLLKQSANVQDASTKMLEIYAAALEIDSANGALQHKELATEVCDHWPATSVTYERPLEEAKLGLVRRLGEAVRRVAKMAASEGDARDRPADSLSRAAQVLQPAAYLQLYQIGIKEKSYPVRLAVALEIAAGGDQAHAHLKEKFSAVLARLDHPDEVVGQSDEETQCRWREDVLCAWLAPLLAGSMSGRERGYSRNGEDADRGQLDTPLPDKKQEDGRKSTDNESPESILNVWLRIVRKDLTLPGSAPFPISLEIALAQGFKYAANRRRHYLGIRAENQARLADKATEMLKQSRFWFTQLTLLHALCLWTLRDEEDPQPVPGGHGSQPEAIVRQWLAIASSDASDGNRPAGGAAHPFVAAAGELVVLALQTQRPENYIWIDESGVTSIIGSHSEGMRANEKQNLWIPPSTGWSLLDPRAQRLVADILVLLNLAERGDRPEERDRRLSFTDRPDLPFCITEDRAFLNTAGSAGPDRSSVPGANCWDDCSFRLCPYPRFGGPSYRVDLSEPFCRNQRAMLGRFGRADAPWQHMRSAALRGYWELMAQRSRGAPRPNQTGT